MVTSKLSNINSIRNELALKIHERHDEICAWYLEQAKLYPLPFYCSIDLRDAGFKMAPVDCNLYPAGFNNICGKDMDVAPKLFKKTIDDITFRLKLNTVKKILILPETHTQNTFYLENLYYLIQLLDSAGFETELAWDNPTQTLRDPIELKTASGRTLTAFPMIVGSKGRAQLSQDFEPDLIILNNDYSGGYPRYLDAIQQPIVPTYKAGWHTRKKSQHFSHYNNLAEKFATLIGVDPWFLQVTSESVDQVNFNESIGLEQTSAAVERILENTRKKYLEYGISQEPFAFIKSNSGTYGMGITVVRSTQELSSLNRREKNKMSVGKNKSAIESVIVQEGIPTSTIIDGLAGEPVIYMVGSETTGGFIRANTERGTEENLNSKGMIFKPLCMSDLEAPFEQPSKVKRENCVLEHVYGSLARLSALAAGKEISSF